MNVLHVYRTYFPDSQGGLEEVIRQICLNTKVLGVTSRVLTLTRGQTGTPVVRDEAMIERVRLDVEIASCGISLAAVGRLRRLTSWADIVHYHYPWPFADVMHFLSGVRQPTVLTYHSDIVRQRLLKVAYAPLMNRFLSAVDHIVCTSPNYFATSETLLRFKHKVRMIPIGIEPVQPLDVSSERPEVRAKYGSDFFLFVGVLRYYKGLHILLEAMKGAPYRCLIVGSGPTQRELQRQAAALQLDNVTFAGYVPDETKNQLYSLCRAVVFPSYMRAEAFGVTLLEGAMHRKPLISTEVGTGTSHVNVHAETGLIVEPGSALELRRAMDQLWNDSTLARSMGRAARKRYETHFTGAVMGQRYAQLYHEAVGRSAAAQASQPLRADGS